MKIVRIALLAALGLTAAAFAGIGLPDRAHGTSAPSGRTITGAYRMPRLATAWSQ